MTRYELLDRIGVGGMAEIFRGKAIAAGGFEKPVAIKRILPHLSQDVRFVELLIAEAKVLSLLKHRNIVQIYDVGLGDDGQYFLVMEYVDGKDLGAVQRGLESKRKRMPLDLVLAVGAEICDALEHAHSARGPDGRPMSLVHRDVSPTNVLVSRAGEIKLTDFGIAKRAEEATGHGAVRGKFAYISPEQARNEHLNARSDLFAVGLLIWELATNRRLYSTLPDLEALRAVREGAVPAPSTADPRLPPELDEVLLTALAADPAKRYPSAGQFGMKLRSLRYSLEVTTGDPATELGNLVELAEQAARDHERAALRVSVSRIGGHVAEPTDATVIRIQTADAFSLQDADGTGLLKARQVIDRFDEEEETRFAHVTAAQLAELRNDPPTGDTTIAPPLVDHDLVDSGDTALHDDDRTVASSPLDPSRLPERSSGELTRTSSSDTGLTQLARDSASDPGMTRIDAPLRLDVDPEGPTALADPRSPNLLPRAQTLPGMVPLAGSAAGPTRAPSQGVTVPAGTSGAPMSTPFRPSQAPPPPVPPTNPPRRAHAGSQPPPIPMTPHGPAAPAPAPWRAPTPPPPTAQSPQQQQPQPWAGQTPPAPAWSTPSPQPQWQGGAPPAAWHGQSPPPAWQGQGHAQGQWADSPAPIPGSQQGGPAPAAAAPSSGGAQLWMLVVGAVIVGVLAFLITRAAMTH